MHKLAHSPRLATRSFNCASRFTLHESRVNRKGFTLIEIMVAVAIMAISLAVLLDFQGNTLKAVGRADGVTQATWLARYQMVELMLELDKGIQKGEFPEEKSENGEFEDPYDGYVWEMNLKKIELPAPPTTKEGSSQDTIAKQLTKEIGEKVRELKVTVTRKEWPKERAIVVTTHLVKI